MFKIKKQISTLYSTAVLSNLSLTGAWIAILTARGFSLVEIGIAETVFHITSLLMELPSGILADVFGRKRMLIVSTVMRMIGNMVMIFSNDLSLVCLSVCFTALSYNFSSGTGDALAYDSLKLARMEDGFERFESNQLMIYRLCGGLSTLCAGFALTIGHKIAYGTDVLSGLIQILLLCSLREIPADQSGADRSILRRLLSCFKESLFFLRGSARALFMMFCNSLVGAMDILLLFFLQAKLPTRGIPQWELGVALLLMELGGIVGAKLILKLPRWSYRAVFAASLAAVLAGILMEHAAYQLMTLGGFLAAVGDDALQVRTNALLQSMFPSQQRATLTSVESLTFSVVMVVLTPLASLFFTRW